MDNHFKVKDLHLIAVLVMKGLRVLDIEVQDKAFIFVFERAEAEPIEKAYWNKEVDGNIRDFVIAIGNVKSQMRSLSMREN